MTTYILRTKLNVQQLENEIARIRHPYTKTESWIYVPPSKKQNLVVEDTGQFWVRKAAKVERTRTEIAQLSSSFIDNSKFA